jgi:SAM-dependent methyltransferase
MAGFTFPLPPTPSPTAAREREWLLLRDLGGCEERIDSHCTIARCKWGNASLNAWTSSLLDIQATDRVLDLGCGPGAALAANARWTAAGFAVGLDYAAVMIRQARRRNAAFVRRGRAGLARGDAAALPFADESFAVVYNVYR